MDGTDAVDRLETARRRVLGAEQLLIAATSSPNQFEDCAVDALCDLLDQAAESIAEAVRECRANADGGAR